VTNANGIAQISDGTLIVASGNNTTYSIDVIDDVFYNGQRSFTTSDVWSIPSSVLYDVSSDKVYISDGGGYEISGSSNHQISAFNSDGTGRVDYDGSGHNSGPFQWPRLTGILPDGRLYIQDCGNNRLIRVDDLNTGDSSWQEYSPTGADQLNLSYWSKEIPL